MLQTLEFLKDGEELLLVGIEQGYEASVVVWKLIEDEVKDVAYLPSFFMDKFVDSKVNKNCLWTLEEGGILKCTHVRTLLS